VPGRYDVFISYHSKAPVGYWVREFFALELKDWLDQQFERPAEVFYDRESIEVGDRIQDTLKTALEASRMFVPVLSPSYFNQSKWCPWEWKCFQTSHPTAVMPVLYYNRASLPLEVQNIKMCDFSEVNAAFPAFKRSVKYGRFQERVRAFAEDLAARLRKLDGNPTVPFGPMPPPGAPPGVPPIDQQRLVA
jgi:hypothetical protein